MEAGHKIDDVGLDAATEVAEVLPDTGVVVDEIGTVGSTPTQPGRPRYAQPIVVKPPLLFSSVALMPTLDTLLRKEPKYE